MKIESLIDYLKNISEIIKKILLNQSTRQDLIEFFVISQINIFVYYI